MSEIAIDIKGDAAGFERAAAQAEATAQRLARGVLGQRTALRATNDEAERYLATLKRQVDTFGLSRGQMAAYDAAQKGLRGSYLAAAQALGEQIDALERHEQLLGRAKIAAAAAGAAIAAALAAAARATVQATMELEQSQARLQAVLNATGHAAGLTRDELERLVEEMEGATLFDDGQVRDAIALLMTFKNVQGDTFRETIRVAGSLAATMKMDLSHAVRMLAQALEEPEHGLRSLRHQGVAFSNAQRDMVVAMVESGRQAEALAAILRILKEQGLDGVAESMRTGITGASNGLAKSWDGLLKTIGQTDLVQGTVSAVFGSLARYLEDMKRVIDSGDWLDRLAFFTLGYTTPSMMKDNQWEGSVGGSEARAARRAAARQRAQQEAERELALGAENLKALERWEQESERAAAARARQEQEAVRALTERLMGTERLTEAEKTAWEIENGRYREFSAGSQARLRELAGRIDAEKAWQDMVQASEEAVKRENVDYQRRRQQERETARRIFEETRTPYEQYAARLEELNAALARGDIEWDTYARAVEAAQARLGQAADQQEQSFADLKRAIEGWGRSFSKTMAEVVMGARRGTRDIADAFRELVQEIIAIQVQKRVTDPLLKAATGWLDGILGGAGATTGDGSTVGAAAGGGSWDDAWALFAGAHGGGIAGREASFLRPLPAAAFAGAPRFHRGGVPGLAPGELPVIVERDEGIFTPEQMKRLAPAGEGVKSVRVEIVNQGQPQEVVSAQPGFDPEGLVIRVVTQDLARNGRIAQGVANTFGLRRRA